MKLPFGGQQGWNRAKGGKGGADDGGVHTGRNTGGTGHAHDTRLAAYAYALTWKTYGGRIVEVMRVAGYVGP